MGLQDLFNWRSTTPAAAAASTPVISDEDLAADVDEPPDQRHSKPQTEKPHNEFHKSMIRVPYERKESLLTRALKSPEVDASKPEIHVTTELSRRRSMLSNASLASTAELTSDGGLTSPSRTNTPSPPFPNTGYTSFAPFSLALKPTQLLEKSLTNIESREPAVLDSISVSPKTQPPAEIAPKKRCITFACGGRKDPVAKPVIPTTSQPAAVIPIIEAPKRPSTIKFACSGPKPSDKSTKTEVPKTPQQESKPLEVKKSSSRSPSMTRRSPRPGMKHRDSTGTVRRASQSPIAVRAKPKYIIADEKTIEESEATRFHEFASGKVEEDDWIRKESDNPRKKLTINDTLKLENDIRRLGNEAEEEALDEDEEDEQDQNGNESDDENGFDEEDEDENDEDDDLDDDASDGNETDNEAGFAESDDESDADGEFAFWTPGRHVRNGQHGEVSTYRPSAHRSASASSIDSLNRRISTKEQSHRPEATKSRRRPRPIKIRPGTPDLPDSTDFVCGTLDEDRPLEDAYVSCMEQRRFAKHKRTPQDIDPSFPTSDIEDEEDENDVVDPGNDSDELWLHGKMEESDDETHGRRRSTTIRRRSPGQSPKRLRSPPPPRRHHSPAPTKTRLRSPPPRKLFGHSPKRMRSPPPAPMIRSPAASPAAHGINGAINFAPLGSRPGLTHTKSLPRTPNAFCRQYMASRLIAANGNANDDTDGHVRGAIDIVKGLEQKRQRRKEKFYQKQNNRKSKGQPERKPQPGKGAERMRELGLLMAGKTGVQDPYMLSA